MKKKIQKIILYGVLVICLIGCQTKDTKVTDISSTMNDNCNYKPQLLVERNDRNIYTYCLNDVTIKINDKEENLKNFIETDDKAIDKIIDTLEYQTSLNDGGTKLYKGEDLILIQCYTIDGNRDVYIGDQNMRFKENFCDNDNYTFVRTYTVKSIKEYNKQQYTDDGIPVTYSNSFEVELHQYQLETQKVIINNLWDIELEKDKTYEFELQLYDESKAEEDTAERDTIEYIFKHSNIIDIRETDKKGMGQLQEPMIER